MSDIESAGTNAADELIERNPKVDGKQLREAQELLGELRRSGVGRPSYEIESPYERRPVSPPESTRPH